MRAILALTLLGGCAMGQAGPLRSDLPQVGTTGVFAARVARQFPDGSGARAMERALRSEGFQMVGDARARWSGEAAGGCVPVLEVSWTEAEGTISRATGRERFDCGQGLGFVTWHG